jgi:hypothetical protein
MRYKRLPVLTQTPRLSLKKSAQSQTLPQANSRCHASLETIIDCSTAIIIPGRSYRNGTSAFDRHAPDGYDGVQHGLRFWGD